MLLFSFPKTRALCSLHPTSAACPENHYRQLDYRRTNEKSRWSHSLYSPSIDSRHLRSLDNRGDFLWGLGQITCHACRFCSLLSGCSRSAKSLPRGRIDRGPKLSQKLVRCRLASTHLPECFFWNIGLAFVSVEPRSDV